MNPLPRYRITIEALSDQPTDPTVVVGEAPVVAATVRAFADLIDPPTRRPALRSGGIVQPSNAIVNIGEEPKHVIVPVPVEGPMRA